MSGRMPERTVWWECPDHGITSIDPDAPDLESDALR